MLSILTESSRLRSIYKLLLGPKNAIVKIKDRRSSTLEPESSSMFANSFEQLAVVSPESETSSSMYVYSGVILPHFVPRPEE